MKGLEHFKNIDEKNLKYDESEGPKRNGKAIDRAEGT